jgi:DNA-binding transcriptional MerR regulator
MSSYTSAQVCQAAGLSYRQLDYACHYIFQGQLQGRPGTGNKRVFTRTQALRLMIIGALLREGVLQEYAGNIARSWDPITRDARQNESSVLISVDTDPLRKELDSLFPVAE